ncbi:MAG TPA: ferrous iron transport protein A [Longimicrobiales bacterium]|nr:ferrous iron transport protein A [Longimicrobiales bacterium]
MSGAVKVSRALATLEPGEGGTVEAIQYGALRALCSDLGIREGEKVRCRAGRGSMLVLDTQDGHTVSLARDWARHILVALSG